MIDNKWFKLTRSEAESFAPTFSLNSVSVNFSPYSSINCVFDIRLVPVQRLAWYRVFLNGWFYFKDWWWTPNQSRKIMNHKHISWTLHFSYIYSISSRHVPWDDPSPSSKLKNSLRKNDQTKKHFFTSLK